MTGRPRIVALVGPTAAGKTGLALHLAQALGAEIISADAVAVYRGLDLGAAKPTAEDLALVRHHLLDVAGPEEEFTAARFAELARQAAADILGRGRRVLVAGGTGLYLRAFLGGLFQAPRVDPALRRELLDQAQADPAAVHAHLAQADPVAAARLHPRDTVRVVRALEVYLQTGRTISSFQELHRFAHQPYDCLKLGLLLDKDALARRVEERTRGMFEAGLVEEVRGLLVRGVDPKSKPLQAIGYRQTLALLRGEIDAAEAVRQTIQATKRLAKRQMTWFRADPEVRWLPADQPAQFLAAARRFWEAEA